MQNLYIYSCPSRLNRAVPCFLTSLTSSSSYFVVSVSVLFPIWDLFTLSLPSPVWYICFLFGKTCYYTFSSTTGFLVNHYFLSTSPAVVDSYIQQHHDNLRHSFIASLSNRIFFLQFYYFTTSNHSIIHTFLSSSTFGFHNEPYLEERYPNNIIQNAFLRCHRYRLPFHLLLPRLGRCCPTLPRLQSHLGRRVHR